MTVLKNRLLIIVFLGLCIFTGCRIIPWWGEFDDKGGDILPGRTIFSRNISTNELVEVDSAEFKLQIPAGAIKSSAALTITAVEASLSGLSWPAEFRPVSEVFSIRLLPEHSTLKFPASMTFAMPSGVQTGKYYVMRRASDGKLSLHERMNTGNTAGFEISTMNLSSWALVEQKASLASQLKQSPIVTTLFATPIAKNGKYQADLTIHTMIASDNQDYRQKGSLKLELASFEPFRLNSGNPLSETSFNPLVSDSENRAVIDLFNSTFASVVSSSELATFSTMIRLKDVSVEEVPEFLAIKASYETPQGIAFDGYSAIWFSKPPTPEAPALVSIAPANNSTGIDPETDVLMEFKSPLNKQTFIDSISVLPEAVISPDSFQWSSDNTQVRFSFTQRLADNTDYAITLATTLEDVYGNRLVQPLISRFKTGDGLAPSILSFIPAENTSHAINASVKVKFSKPVAENTAVISFTPPPANGFNAIWNSDEVEIFPLPAWADNSQIEFSLAAGLADLNGKRTSTPQVRTFSTGNFKLAQIVDYSPVNNSFDVSVNSNLVLTFDQAMKQAETEAAISFGNGFPATRSFSWNAENTVLTISFEPRLKFATACSIEVSENAESQTGSKLNGTFPLLFNTIAGIEPAIVSSNPENNAENVNLKKAAILTFATAMNIASVNNSISLKDSLGTDVPFNLAWTDQTTVTITPSADFQPSKDYTIRVSDSAMDNNGARFFEPAIIGFQTAANYPAVLISTDPAANETNVAYNKSVKLVFSEVIAQDTFSFTIQPELPGGFQTTWDANGKECIIDFNSGFASNTLYRLKILESTKDIGGQNISNIPELVFTSETFNAPRILSLSPASGSMAIPANSSFEILFDSAMDQSATNAAISFEPALSGLVFNWSDSATRLNISRSAILSYDSQYYLNIAKAAKRADGEELLNSYRAAYKTAPQTSVDSVSPANGATGISAYTDIKLQLTQEFNLSEVQNRVRIAAGAQIIAGSFNRSDRKIIFSPSESLPLAATIQVELQAGAQDINGLPVLPFTSSFTVENTDTTAPEVVSSQPVAGSPDVPLNQIFEVTFNKTMQTSSVTSAFSITPTPAGTRTFSWSNSNKTLTISYSEPLSHSTSYQLRIDSSASDPGGRSMPNNYLLSFSTVARPEVVLSKCFPQPSAIGIQLKPNILVEFSKAMNQASAQNAFSLKNGSVSISGNFVWLSDRKMQFTPSSDLSPGVSHSISINSLARDTGNNYLESTVAWSFTTASEEGKTWFNNRAQTDSTDLFARRYDHSMVTFANKLWVIGGYNGEYLNDVWSSSNGTDWVREVATGTAGMFAGRAGHACVVFNNRIWLTGGFSELEGAETYYSDVWYSLNGKTWTRATPAAGYYRRAWHNMQVFADRLWVLGGESFDEDALQPVLLDDSWSSLDGVTWTERSSITAFFPRKNLMSGVIGGKLWVWGGYGQNQNGIIGALNDIWSTTNGDFWTLVSNNGSFAGRCGAGFTAHNNRVWLIGGSTLPEGGTRFSDVWASGDGNNWTQILPDSAGSSQKFGPRAFFGLSSLSNKLFLSGGISSSGILNEVWSSQ